MPKYKKDKQTRINNAQKMNKIIRMRKMLGPEENILSAPNYQPNKSNNSFPKNPEVKEKWIAATGRKNWFPTRTSTVCSKHFFAKDFNVKKRGKRFLFNTAVPMLDVPQMMNAGSGLSEACSSSVPSPPQYDDDSSVSSDFEGEIPEIIHEEVSCSNCGRKIVGFRYKCLSCANYNLCYLCEGREIHPEHYVLRIPRPITIAKEREIVRPIQKILATEEAAVPSVSKQQKNDDNKKRKSNKISIIYRSKANVPEIRNEVIGDANADAIDMFIVKQEPEIIENEVVGGANKEAIDPLVVKQEPEDLPVEFSDPEQTVKLPTQLASQEKSCPQPELCESRMDYADTLFFLGIRPEDNTSATNTNDPTSSTSCVAADISGSGKTSDQIKTAEITKVEVKSEPECNSDEENISVFTHHTGPKKRRNI